MDLIGKVFETKRNIQSLHLCSRLHLPPTSETNTLFSIYGMTIHQAAPGISVSELANFLNVSAPTVSRCIQKLSAKGYVQKAINEQDKRGTCVSLTPEGKTLCMNAYKNLSGFTSRVLSRLDPSELEQFVMTMDKIYEAVRAELDDGEEAADI